MEPFELILGDCTEALRTLEPESVQCCVTSPPYWGLRDYGHEDQIGMEPDPYAFVAKMVEVFREVRRVLKPDGVLWLNLGDTYAQRAATGRQGSNGSGDKRQRGASTLLRSRSRSAGLKPKDLIGVPWRVALALQDDGWWLRSDVIWHKPNPMPESVTDRPTKAHEYVFLLTKGQRYFYDARCDRGSRMSRIQAAARGAGDCGSVPVATAH